MRVAMKSIGRVGLRFHRAEDLSLRAVARAYKEKGPGQKPLAGPFRKIPGSDLLSHTPADAVPSAVAGLTSVFGMGTGVTLPL